MYKFRERFSHYEQIEDLFLYFDKLPSGMTTTVGQLITRELERINSRNPHFPLAANAIILHNKAAFYVGWSDTDNWGYSFVKHELLGAIEHFNHKPLYKFMDYMAEVMNFFSSSSPELYKEFNEVFEENDFGYRLQVNQENPWICLKDTPQQAIDMDTAIQTLDEVCKQAADHIREAQKKLIEHENLRSMKDALHDTLSAMEAILQAITSEKDVENATRFMKENTDIWGDIKVLHDGQNIWKLMHEKYEDIRHGNPEISAITYDEIIYYIDKTLAFVAYIIRIAKRHGII